MNQPLPLSFSIIFIVAQAGGGSLLMNPTAKRGFRSSESLTLGEVKDRAAGSSAGGNCLSARTDDPNPKVTDVVHTLSSCT